MTYYTDALTDGLTWTGLPGSTAIVDYSFGISHESGALFTTARQTEALAAMNEWSHVANITFTASSNASAVLTFSTAELGTGVDGLTTTFFSGNTIISSEVQIDDDLTTITPGSYGYTAFLHEIGHALGLKHPANYSGSEDPPFLPANEDSRDYTVMSYHAGVHATDSNAPITPMIYDIAAIQELYGANTSYNAGNTTYNFTGANVSETLWDGGGTDTLNASGYSGISQLDLREGISNVSLIGQTSVWIAFNAHIENATGGAGHNIINGNALANQLIGNGGSDDLHGNEGNDTIYGGSGASDPSDAADSIYGGAGIDHIYGNGGNDTIYGGLNAADTTDAADLIYGNEGSDQIWGNGGNDTIYGGIPGDTTDAADTLTGGAGNDLLNGNGGNDKLYGGIGNDTLGGGAGNDIFYFASGSGVDTINSFDAPGAGIGDLISVAAHINGSDIDTAAEVLAHVSYSAGMALLDLGGGNIIHILGVSAGAFTVADFVIG